MSETKVKKDLEIAVQKARTIKITDERTFQAAGKTIIDLKEKMKALADWWKPKIDAAKKNLEEIRSGFDEQNAPAKALHDELKAAANEYQRAIQEEARRLEAAQREAEKNGQGRKASNLEKKLQEVPLGSRAVSNGSAAVTDQLVVEVTDPLLFLAEIAKGNKAKVPVPLGVLDFLKQPLKNFVKLNKLSEFPGLSIRTQASVSFRGK